MLTRADDSRGNGGESAGPEARGEPTAAMQPPAARLKPATQNQTEMHETEVGCGVLTTHAEATTC